MSETVSSLRFCEGSLRLATPWGGEATATMLVNDENVEETWGADQQGRPTCQHGPWRLTVVEGAKGSLSLEIANVSQAPLPLRTVHFGRFSPAAFSHALDTLSLIQLSRCRRSTMCRYRW